MPCYGPQGKHLHHDVCLFPRFVGHESNKLRRPPSHYLFHGCSYSFFHLDKCSLTPSLVCDVTTLLPFSNIATDDDLILLMTVES